MSAHDNKITTAIVSLSLSLFSNNYSNNYVEYYVWHGNTGVQSICCDHLNQMFSSQMFYDSDRDSVGSTPIST